MPTGAATMLFGFFQFRMAAHLCAMNEGSASSEQKEWAKHLYTSEGKNTRHIADLLQVDEGTIRQWIAEGSWDALKKTLPSSKEYQLEQLYKLLEQTTEKLNCVEEVNPKDVDLVIKYTAAIKNLDTEPGLQQIVEVAKLFTSWLRKKDAGLMRTVVVEFDKFIKERLKPAA